MAEGDSQNEEVTCANEAITLAVNGVEKLKVTADGFFVNGEAVTVDEQHDQNVYQALKDWLTATQGGV